MTIDAKATIVGVDSVTTLAVRHAGSVVVTGSHGGMVAARYAAAAGVRAVVFNDAGGGLDDAGIAGLRALEDLGLAAAAVAHISARIGDAGDSLAHGRISHVNASAAACGIVHGMACRDAAARLLDAPQVRAQPLPSVTSRHLLLSASRTRSAVIGLDSIGALRVEDTDAVLVIGSHGALHGGDPASALPVDARAAFFHDAGRGKDDAGVSRLPVLGERGVAAGAVDYRSARIGDARSLWLTGIVSCVNAPMAERQIRAGMRVREAVRLLRASAQET